MALETRRQTWSRACARALAAFAFAALLSVPLSATAPKPALATFLEAGAAIEADNSEAIADETGSVEMFRLYNPNTGEHFYTGDEAERDNLKSLGWRFEGCGWVAPEHSDTPVYRLYSGTDHHYTTSKSERDELVKAGWKDEGVGWYSDDAETIRLFRLYNPNVDPNAAWFNSGGHHYTTSAEERDSLAQAGWVDEGECWCALEGGYSTGDWVSALNVAQSVDQLIMVEGWGVQAIVSMHEKTDGEWHELFRTTEGWVGENGIGSARAYAAYTPTGVMYPDAAFGNKDNPGCPMGYIKADSSIWWCGDNYSPLYNHMVSTRDTTDFDMSASEHIQSIGATYNYCLNMGWNPECIPFGGSAFFMHCSQHKPTGGCVTVPEYLMVEVLRAIRPGCAIVIDTPSGVMQY